MPTPLLSHKSLYETLHSQISNYSHLEFSIVYVMQLMSLQITNLICVHFCWLYIPLVKKRYQVYDRETRKFLTSQDVAFHEHIFPFSTMTHAI
jgi:hypothetical protein